MPDSRALTITPGAGGRGLLGIDKTAMVCALRPAVRIWRFQDTLGLARAAPKLTDAIVDIKRHRRAQRLGPTVVEASGMAAFCSTQLTVNWHGGSNGNQMGN